MRTLITGTWITIERIRAYAWIFVSFWVVVVVGLIATSSANLDFMGRPLGTDFANVWTAGVMALEGQPLGVYDPPLHHQMQIDTFANPDMDFYGWHYPPFFLMIAIALALLPYGTALLIWMVLTLPLYMTVLSRIVPGRLARLVILAFPGTLINLLHGQNGFLSAALLGAGLLCLDRRPVVAGVAFGLLSYKPQLGVLIPLVLIATARWKVFGVATLTVGVLLGASTALFGIDIWQAFYANTQFTREVVLEAGAMGWEKPQSVFAAVRAVGGSISLAYALQGALAVCVGIATIWMWRTQVDFSIKAAGLVTGALLVTPYVMDYDLVMLALSLAWFTAYGLKSGFLDWEKTALAAVWAVPLFSRVVAHTTYVPLGLLVMVGFFILILKRVHHENKNGAVIGSQC